MISFFVGLVLLSNTLADDSVGGVQDDHGCLTGAGYTWCKSSGSCMRGWVTPCEDNFNGCVDCLQKQRLGMNIACPGQCDNIAIDPLPPNPLPPNPLPPYICSDLICMMYCPSGHRLDENGCQMCQCNDPPISVAPPISVDQHTNNCPLVQPSCDGHTYVCPKLTEITHCNAGGIDGYTTYQLSLVVQPNTYVRSIYAIYGNDDLKNVMYIPPAYQSPDNHGQNIGGVDVYMNNVLPDTTYDSWLTIGLTDGDPSNTISAVGIDFNSWTEYSGLVITNGAVFVMDPQDIDLTIQGTEIIIAQLTVPTLSTSTAIFNVQGKTDTITTQWSELNIKFPLIAPSNIDTNTIPLNCVSWFDGCNSCVSNNGVLSACTRLMCFIEDEPQCLQYSTPGH